MDSIHVSGSIFTQKGSRLTSFHCYTNGKIVFSKKKYGEVTFTPREDQDAGPSGSVQGAQSAAPGLATGLTWRMEDGGRGASFWDGKNWIPGQ